MPPTEVWLLLGDQPVDLHPEQPLSLPAALRETLAVELAPLAALDALLPNQLQEFVESGRHDACLRSLADTPEATTLLGLSAVRNHGVDVPRALWLGACARFSPLLAVRLGVLFAACTHGYAKRYGNTPAPGPGYEWPSALVREACWISYTDTPQPEGLLDMGLLETALAATGSPPDFLVRRFAESPYRYMCRLGLPSFGDGFVRYPEHVARALDQKGKPLEKTLSDFIDLELPVLPWLSRLVALATVNAKAIREQARRWILQASDHQADTVADSVASVLQSGSADARSWAAELLGLLQNERASAALRARLETESAPKVRSTIEAVLAANEVKPDARPPDALPAPYDPSPTETLSAAVRTLFEQLLDEYTLLQEQSAHTHSGRRPQLVSAAQRETYWKLLADPAPWREAPQGLYPNPRSVPVNACKSLRPLLDHPELTPVHLARLSYLLHGHYFTRELDPALRRQRRRCGVAYDLRTVALALEHCGLSGKRVGSDHASNYAPSFRWEPAAVWPYFAEHPEQLDAALGMGSASSDANSQGWALAVLSCFPSLPQRYQGVAWSHAMGSNAGLARLGRQCLANVPDLVERVLATLSDKTQDVRAAAAAWLGQIGDARAIEPLKAALAKEKQAGPRARYLEALERLGVPSAQLIDRDQLCAEARRGLAKGFPTQIAWLRRDSAPQLRWLDGSPIPREVSDWWLTEAYKGKEANGNGLLDVYARQVRPDDRIAFARWVLEEWLRQDQRLPESPAELALAVEQLEKTWGREFAERMAPNHKGSALAERGVLALASSFGNAELVPLVRAYLTKWYGKEAAHCNHLLSMLAWNQSPAAIQYLTAVSRRFRTASIQKKAAELVGEIARRNGWTRIQLADRSIPDAGLDERGRLELCYLRAGSEETSRTFLATLQLDGSLKLTGPDGSVLKALPEGRKDEDEASVKQAKQLLTAAKKEIKTTYDLQTSRLYDAMCTQRAWRYDEWDRYFRGHPIASRLVTRLIWRAELGPGRSICFRAMEDGSLLATGDAEVQLDAEREVRLAHSSQLDDAELVAWRQHGHDFDFMPLFGQVERPVYRPGEDQLDDTTLEQFRGHVVDSFTLRRLADKRGYNRGALGDGQYFYEYQRAFADIGVLAELQFTGNSLPEANLPVALKSLSFAVSGQSTDGAGRVMLRDVPAVLISECFNDLAEIAAAGSGFDPNWQKLER